MPRVIELKTPIPGPRSQALTARRAKAVPRGVPSTTPLAVVHAENAVLTDADGNRLTPTHAVKKGRRYRYYVSMALITGTHSEHPKGRRIPAGDIEGLVLDRLRALFASGEEISDAIAPLGSTPQPTERCSSGQQSWLRAGPRWHPSSFANWFDPWSSKFRLAIIKSQ